MSQHDYVIENQAGLAFRSDLNEVLAAIVSGNSGATAPTTTYPYMWWADTTSGWMKQRSATNEEWLNRFPLSLKTSQFGASLLETPDAAAARELLGAGFVPGTAMLFVQAAAPLGWTKSTAHNNKALRIVSGVTGGGSGGTVDFTTAFKSQAVAGAVGNTTLGISHMPWHAHGGSIWRRIGGTLDVGTAGSGFDSATDTDGAGGGSAHNHSFTGTAIDLAVKYVDAIIATKD